MQKKRLAKCQPFVSSFAIFYVLVPAAMRSAATVKTPAAA
jgi:hypothetical protein